MVKYIVHFLTVKNQKFIKHTLYTLIVTEIEKSEVNSCQYFDTLHISFSTNPCMCNYFSSFFFYYQTIPTSFLATIYFRLFYYLISIINLFILSKQYYRGYTRPPWEAVLAMIGLTSPFTITSLRDETRMN